MNVNAVTSRSVLLQRWHAATAQPVRISRSQSTGRPHFQPRSVTHGIISSEENAKETLTSIWELSHQQGTVLFSFPFHLYCVI